jgi:TRAP-type C4-dicarboxylate transport system substrate-binding protein
MLLEKLMRQAKKKSLKQKLKEKVKVVAKTVEKVERTKVVAKTERNWPKREASTERDLRNIYLSSDQSLIMIHS